jgi:aromatic ring-opening dioxygenase catalytic subunit (LigB family)
MAELVGVIASSHAPLMARAWDAVDATRLESISRTFAEMARRLRAAKPDVLVVVSPDHWVNFFLNNLPSICIGVGDTHKGPPEPWLKHLPYASIAGHPDFAAHLAQTALDEGFEPSLSHHLELDHGFVIPLWKMGIDPLPPIVPVIVNTIEPPMPSLRRCLAWGDLLRTAIERYPADLRVAIMATGGVSHSIGAPDMGRIDEAFDRECFEQLRSADLEGLLAFLERRLEAAGNGAAEMRNWLMAHAAAKGKGFELLGYHPYPEWYVGCGFAAWNLGGR